MLADFFQLTPTVQNQIVGTYDLRLVVLSYIVASCASYIALDITGRLRDVGNTQLVTFLWVLGGAIAMGAGIWSMHFIGMLSFSIPGMFMRYDPTWTAISLIVAIVASGFALSLLKAKVINVSHFILGGIILGIAIASMHYTGMEAMREFMNFRYFPGLFCVSIFVAIAASEAALWLAIKSNSVIANMRIRLKMVSALVMGAAICGMHYTGMAATVFMSGSMKANYDAHPLNPNLLAMAVAGVTIVILGIAFFVSNYKEALNQQMIMTARQAGMADVAASVLHNVGNVLNSVNVSATVLLEKITQSRLNNLPQMSQLLEEQKNNFVHFLSQEERGIELQKYLRLIGPQWEKEQQELTTETNALIKNINHIRNIIATQQELSKVKTIDHIHAIEPLIEESLLITGLTMNNQYNIQVEKNYANLKSIYLDKVKILQILVNLLTNAKEALGEVTISQKKITITTGLRQNKFFIKITDMGCGINPADLTHIFSYGFTTKESGHGFGLHGSALTAKEMGGTLQVKSEGKNKGAVFTLELPYKLP